MNFKSTGIILTTLATLAIPMAVQAQKAQTPIGNLPNSRLMSISGEVTQLFHDEFLLNDGTGQIIVEAEPQWGQPMNLSVGEQVTVVGRYDDNEFEAFSITNSQGQTIQIHDD
ncbi:hypothetical protein PCC7424_0693 [Gloeothece citriformis PCC 7424]|uniref:Bacterial OB-fold domain-containing protein n=1 Tax=Gloeothece citriformis (strain PCC 7424) TaxID=65393 RepID=B7KFV6_GLOC7|nr:hypothetical protein [Gloeothece citriformis]ACK69149.1 hypothetical protein PCC7424_0693 [Gloeothece citriformis PCC 7424]